MADLAGLGSELVACAVFRGTTLVVALLLASCSSGSTDDGSAPTPSASAPAISRDRGVRVQTLGEVGVVVSPQSPQDRLDNGLVPLPDTPVFAGDYADPFVLAQGETLYLYTTNTEDENVPVLASAAGAIGAPLGDALPDLPGWTEPGRVWAPSVLELDEGYVLYFTSEDTASGLQCVGAAASDDPRGPFVDTSDGPLVCQRDLGGTIDASPFLDPDGNAWLLYKNDGNCCDLLTRIWSQRLSPDGLSVEGDPASLVETSEDWEGPLVEGPSMVPAADGGHWLFYSANWWDSADYAVGAARCASPTGPCTKVDGPWLATHADVSGPGGSEAFVDARGTRWMIYHAWVGDQVGYDEGGGRALFALPLDVSGDLPVAVGLDDASG